MCAPLKWTTRSTLETVEWTVKSTLQRIAVSEPTSTLLTAKGKRTRDRIVAAAAALMVERGVAAVSLDEVGRATSTSKSQMYHYFGSKEGLISAVVALVGSDILRFQRGLLVDVASIDDVERWADAIVVAQRQGATYSGCPLGTLASELSGDVDHPQPQIERAFVAWETLLEDGLARMVANGVLIPGTDPHRLAVATLAALQGGLLMAKATQDEASLRIPLEAAVAHLRTFEAT